jgi:ParB-like chromosome segregation protein Spo0J
MDHSMTPPFAGKAVTPLAMAKKVEMWHLDRLIPYAKNARTHSPEQIAQIQASIQEFGFTNPILVDGADGILAGHGRLAAAKDMGLAEVPVIVLDHLSAEQRRAYILTDNQLALNAGWDMELLQQEIVGLNLADFDLSLLGFDDDRIASLLDPEGIDREDEGSPEEFKEVDEDIETDHRCPSCGYEWSGKTK